MKRVAGSILIAFAVLCMAATVLWVGLELTGLPDDATEDDRTAFVAMWLFTGVLVALEVAMFLGGLYLRRPCPDVVADRAKKRDDRRLLPLAIYLGGSVVTATVAVLVWNPNFKFLKPLAFLTFQPTMLAQLILGGFLGIKIGAGATGCVALFTFSLLYFAAFLYPLYRILTMDRTVEVISYRRMMILLILLGSVHLLTILVVFVLSQA